MKTLALLLVLLLAAPGAAGMLERARRVAGDLPPPPDAETARTADEDTLRSWSDERRELFQAVKGPLPVVPAPGGTTGAVTSGDPPRELARLALQLRFLSLLELSRGRVVEGCRAALRVLRLAVDWGSVAGTGDDMRLALTLEAGAYRDLARGILTGAMDERRVQRMGKLLGEWLRLWPARKRLPELIRRRRAQLSGRGPKERLAVSVLDEYLGWALGKAERWRPMVADGKIEARAEDLLRREGDLLASFVDPPLLRGLGSRLARVEAAQAMAVSSVGVALFRHRKGRWPRQAGEIPGGITRDPLGGGDLAYLLVDGEPVLVSAGLDGRLDGGRVPEDLVVAGDALLRKVERVGSYADSFPVGAVGRLHLPHGAAPRTLRPPARADCRALRAELGTAREDLERELGAELLDDPVLLLALLQREGYHTGPTRCPSTGLWRLVAGQWICSRHPSGYDPRVGYADQLMIRTVCQRRRLGDVPAIERFHREIDHDLVEDGKRYRWRLLEDGYLEEPSGCPEGGSWSLTREGLTCSRHLPVVRVPAKED